MPLFLHPQNAGDMSRLKDYHLWNVLGFPQRDDDCRGTADRQRLVERLPRLRSSSPMGAVFCPIRSADRSGVPRHARASRDLPKPPSAYLENILSRSLTHDQKSLRFLVTAWVRITS